MNAIKYELVKLGLIISWLGVAVVACVLGVNMVFLNYRLFGGVLQIIGYIIFGVLLVLAFVFTRLRNKYRDLAEYDANGISLKYGDFSALSNTERAEIERQKMAQREMLIDSITLKRITKRGSVKPDVELNGLIGLQDLKQEIHKMQARMQFSKIRKKKNNDFDSANHMVFMGNPGTGKTSVVKIITGILYENKLIRKNQYIEVDGNFFNGDTAGESTDKIKYIIDKARGGVLFIDEAYALLNSYESQEVIATLIAAMENYRKDFVVILAGYTKEMEMLINSNEGFRSRIRYFLNFPDYSLDELWQIFVKMSNSKGFAVEDDVKDVFTSYMLEEMQNKNYGNARTVRTVLDKAIDNHSVNFIDEIISKNDKFRLVNADLPVNDKIKLKSIIM